MVSHQNSEEIQKKLNEWNDGKERDNELLQAEAERNQNALTIEISGFFKQTLIIHDAKVYNEDCMKKKEFILSVSGINRNFPGDIRVNGISVKSNKYVAKYLQSNSLILTKDTFLHKNLTLMKNLKILSLMYANCDLSNAALSSFSMKNHLNTLISDLPKNKKQIAILSLSVACPAVFWIIDKSLLSGLMEEEIALWENVVKIRTKHGGAIMLI